jgi:hypothetical protein
LVRFGWLAGLDDSFSSNLLLFYIGLSVRFNLDLVCVDYFAGSVAHDSVILNLFGIVSVHNLHWVAGLVRF